MNINTLNLENLAEKKATLVPQIKAFQRLLRIIPKNNHEAALALMGQGIHSALQIAAMTRRDFMGKVSNLFQDNGTLANAIYRNALEKRSAILIQYMNILQNGEPHISQQGSIEVTVSAASRIPVRPVFLE